MRRNGSFLSAIVLFLILSAQVLRADDCPVTGLGAEYRYGQVFLTWREPPGEHRGTFNVYLSDKPLKGIADLEQAQLLAERIEAHSARDWWKDPATYFKKDSVAAPEGFVIDEGEAPLDPSGGLFVHTVGQAEPESAYYAVTMSVDNIEDRRIQAGANSLDRPVIQRQARIRPVWLGKVAEKPSPDCAAGIPAIVSLHGRTGSQPESWLFFGTKEMGWREGLPFKFHAVLKENYLWVVPTDRTWLGRTLSESWDGRDHLSPANDTFWYGYNDHVYDRELMADGMPVNFTERRNLWILSWARNYFDNDPDRTVLEGGSMGGCGGLSWGLRHPELFSAVMASVPLVGYFGKEWGGSEKRLNVFCGPLDNPDNEGVILRTRMDSRTLLAESTGKGIDLPFLIISNARRDASIPWRPNPRYYRALNESRQGFITGWDNGVHSNCMDGSHPWFRKWQDPEYLLRFSLKESFPALSGYSHNNDPGSGDPEEGDITGYMNFGLEWKDIHDEKEMYAITLYIAEGDPVLPATVDVTPRRLQHFRLKPGEPVTMIEQTLDSREILRRESRADRTGHVTFEGFRLTARQGNRLIIIRKPGQP
ncbi:alpha/beta hydrolase-fold protein [Gemmatimonadota bacterium]